MVRVGTLPRPPDDEVLLTSGILAGAAAVGHRVVIVVAADGHVTAVSDAAPSRLGELRASAAVLGMHRVEHLSYADSGMAPSSTPTRRIAGGSCVLTPRRLRVGSPRGALHSTQRPESA